MTRYLCDARVFDIGSFTDPEKTYRVVIPVDPAVAPTCTCSAFFYRTRGSDGGCKHIGDVVFNMEVAGDEPTAPVPGRVDIVDLLAETFASGYRAGARGLTNFKVG